MASEVWYGNGEIDGFGQQQQTADFRRQSLQSIHRMRNGSHSQQQQQLGASWVTQNATGRVSGGMFNASPYMSTAQRVTTSGGMISSTPQLRSTSISGTGRIGGMTSFGGLSGALPGGPTGMRYTTSSAMSSAAMASAAGQRYRSTGGSVHYGSATGQSQNLLGVNTYVDESRSHVISERVVEHEVRIPKKVVREDVVERVIVVPEKFVHEEVVEETAKVREKIVEVAKPIIQERIIEVPEIEYIEKIVEVPEIVYQEKIREVPRVEIQERIIEIPRIVMQEKIVEVPEIEYREIPIEKIVEVPEVREQVVLKEIPVPQYIDKPIPQHVTVEVEQEVVRNIPVPVEAVTRLELKLPKIRPRYTRVDIPLYVPRFLEVPVPVEMLDSQAAAHIEAVAQQVVAVATTHAVGLCEIERVATTVKNLDMQSAFLTNRGMAVQDVITRCWNEGRFQGVDTSNMRRVAAATYETTSRNINFVMPATEEKKDEGFAVVNSGFTASGVCIHGGYRRMAGVLELAHMRAHSQASASMERMQAQSSMSEKKKIIKTTVTTTTTRTTKHSAPHFGATDSDGVEVVKREVVTEEEEVDAGTGKVSRELKMSREMTEEAEKAEAQVAEEDTSPADGDAHRDDGDDDDEEDAEEEEDSNSDQQADDDSSDPQED